MPENLDQAARLIKAHQYARAKTALDKYLAQNPDDARAWYLLSFTEKTSARKLDALREAHRLAPDNAQITARLKKIETAVLFPRAAARKRSQTPLLVGLVVLVVVAIGVIAVIVSNGGRAVNVPMPTPHVLATAESVADAVTPTEAIAETAEATRPPATKAATTAAVTTETAATTAPTNAPTTISAVSVSTSALATDAPTDSATTFPATNAPDDAPTSALTLTPAPPTATTPPTDEPVAISEPGIPINQGANVGVGNLRIVAVTRPAAESIRELGGSIPDAPTNQEWVLVEVLLRCADESNCALSPAAFYLSGTSGQTYPVSPDFNIDPILGSLLANGQLWGYLGFVVSKSDGDLRLVMQNQDTRYVFAAS